MSLEDEIKAGFAAAESFAGEPFTLSNHSGIFRGVFRGDESPTAFDDIQGYDVKTTNAVSVDKSRFVQGDAPAINERVENSNGERYTITGVESGDGATWDLTLQKRDV